ncbi:hypothetical protein [Nocardioides jiangxiensis]|uniref:Uncharacterized protein n=1 Tax=Nocardioides jiangxiensis TaxID=3064524 RepID=A0ABT9B1C3_9ACTN|nr:hypothetical protein [Nocardioides sp. WY-20]MDO7868522.1 hypothetical protein [Nocardioides sp. WY-20]
MYGIRLYRSSKGKRVKVLPVGEAVADAIHPSALARLEGRVRDDLRMALHLLKHAETLAQLATTRAAALTRLTPKQVSDFHYGTPASGLILRPIDDRGRPIPVDQNPTGLSRVLAVAICAVGMSLKEAIDS